MKPDMIVEETRSPKELGWLLSWRESSHTSFLIQAGSTVRRLGGLIEVGRPDIDAIARIMRLLWQSNPEPRVARVLVRTYEPASEALAELELANCESLESGGLEAHLFDVDSYDSLEEACRALWQDSYDFLVFYGPGGQDLRPEGATDLGLSLEMPEGCGAIAGKYQLHSESVAVVVRREMSRDWHSELQLAVTGAP